MDGRLYASKPVWTAKGVDVVAQIGTAQDEAMSSERDKGN